MKTRLDRLPALVRGQPIWILVLGLVLGLLGLGGYRTGLYLNAQNRLHEAEQATDRYEFDEAEQHLRYCLRVHPRDAGLHLRMARVARRANHFELAKKHLRECQRLERKNPENSLEALLLRAQVGDIADVEDLLLEQVYFGSPDANLILEALAQGYNLIYHLDASMGCLNRLLERQPDNVSALLLRATLWTTAGNYSGALEDCRRAVEAQPNHHAARFRFADALLRTERPEEALRQFEYLRQQPGGDAADVRLNLARSHRQLGHTEIARQMLDELLVDNPHDSFALIERGKIALENESPAAAEKWFRQAVTDYLFDAQGNYLLALALHKQGKDEEARRYEAAQMRIESDSKALRAAFQRVLADPRDPEPRLEAARICLRNGRDDEGERWLLSAVEQVPEHAATRAALADFYQRGGKADLAALYRRPLGGKGAGGRTIP